MRPASLAERADDDAADRIWTKPSSTMKARFYTALQKIAGALAFEDPTATQPVR